MNWRLALLGMYLPGFLQRRSLAELHRRTAAAFGRDYPAVKSRTLNGLLHDYAAFSRDQAQAVLDDGGDLQALARRLRREAREMGAGLRRELHLKTDRDFRAALRLVYRALGIDLRASAEGEVLVYRCFFSRFYSARVCGLISALDDGLVEGLSSGAYHLRFTSRLTEGASCCRALLEQP